MATGAKDTFLPAVEMTRFFCVLCHFEEAKRLRNLLTQCHKPELQLGGNSLGPYNFFRRDLGAIRQRLDAGFDRAARPAAVWSRHRRGHAYPVTLIQRFGSAANLNIHLHCLVLGGVYLNRDGAAVFHENELTSIQVLR